MVREGAEGGLVQWRKPGAGMGGSAGMADSWSGETGIEESAKGSPGESGKIETGTGGITVSDVRGTKSGAYYIVDVELSVPGDMTVDTFQGIKKEVTEGVMEKVKSAKIVRVFVKSMGLK